MLIMLMECEGFWPTVSSILGWVLATYSGFYPERFLPTDYITLMNQTL